MICNNCGAKLNPNSKFCKICKQKLELYEKSVYLQPSKDKSKKYIIIGVCAAIVLISVLTVALLIRI